MPNGLLILQTILALLLVMALGWGARRGGVLSREGTLAVGRIAADVALPVLCFKGLLDTDARTLREGWLVPVLGFATLVLSTGVGFALSGPFCRSRATRPTFVFCIAIGNWIFLPLPLVRALYPHEGAAVVLLHNVGAQVFLWTFGLWTLRGGRLDRDALRGVVRNAGLWATAAGITGALYLAMHPIAGGPFGGVARPIGLALDMIAGLTIPLATLAIGAQLADFPAGGADARALSGVLVGRLIVVPVLVIATLSALGARATTSLPLPTRMTEYIIATMPVSLSVGALVARFEGDVRLASRAIALTTVLSVGTVPFFHALAARMHL